MSDKPDLHAWEPLVVDLAARRTASLEMGGPERVQRQESMGKWPVRRRLDVLFDPGTFVEFGQLAD
ncbi:MAG: hypothetical protein WKF43_06090 [Acidimicrobiales bacterium]